MMKHLIWILPMLIIVSGLALLPPVDAEPVNGIMLQPGQQVRIQANQCSLSVLKNFTWRILIRCDATALNQHDMDSEAEAGAVQLEAGQSLRIRPDHCELKIERQTTQRIRVRCSVPTPTPTRTRTPTRTSTPPACPAPFIEFTFIPPYNSFNDLEGRTNCIEPSNYGVAVFIKVPQYGWFNKPYWESPVTTIQSDGTFTTDITTGGVDETATEICAFLVPSGYVPPRLDGAASLPSTLYQFPRVCAARHS